MNGLRNCQSTPKIAQREQIVIDSLGRPDRHSSSCSPTPVFSLNFFSQTPVWASSLSTAAIAKHFSFRTTLPFL
jgi:hypothetical protein